ncbi:MAG: class I SAM-dependent methyltransferase family protein [Candidatus Aenigmarchaeota archaeon]|nr:class I SAM-dependent methyltransferase family protein [Candidatus Aenigmarchaeota archaeon]
MRNGNLIVAAEPVGLKIQKSYPVTDLAPVKPLIGEKPYGQFDSEKEVIKYIESLGHDKMTELSDLYRVMMGQKGGFCFTDRLYEDNPRTPLDRLIYNMSSCRSVHTRKHIVREQLIKLFKDFEGREGMNIHDLGSGPSDYTVEAFSKIISGNGRHFEQLPHATCIDTNPEALERGSVLAKEACVGDHIAYKHGNIAFALKRDTIKRDTGKGTDLIMAIGLICPLSDETTLDIFDGTLRNLKEGGKFYTCAMGPHPLKNFLDSAGWKLRNRTPEELEKMMKQAGFEVKEIYLDPYGYFSYGIGQKT